MKRLIVIMISIIGTITLSCIKEYETSIDFCVKNASGHDVSLFVSKSDIEFGHITDTILAIPNEAEFVYNHSEKGKGSGEYVFPFGLHSDSACITFNDGLRLIYLREGIVPRNILHKESYVGGKVSEKHGLYHYQYTYTITEADYINAVK